MNVDGQIECAGFTFLANFDSANLGRVELVPKKIPLNVQLSNTKSNTVKGNKSNKTANSTKTNKTNVANKLRKKVGGAGAVVEVPDFEFNLWTKPDCFGTEYENTNRTWFYFGVRSGSPFSLVKLNIIDLNKQCKMYSQGMAPVYKLNHSKQWERIRDKPVFTVDENNVFTLSFKFRTLESLSTITYFAFTYPFSYNELQVYLSGLDSKMSNMESRFPKSEIKSNKGLKITSDVNDAIYYHRECVCLTLEGRRIDLITVSSHHNITAEREPRLFKLFPNENIPRPFKFQDKKVIFVSARVHPGETPSSFVLNGLLNLLTCKDDPVAVLLRKQFVFKLMPMLNPDGVVRGHYRTDTRGVNLNRYYLNPSFELHPAIYAARQLIRYHHYGCELEDDVTITETDTEDASSQLDHNELSSLSSTLDVEEDGESTSNINNVQNQINDLILSEKDNTTTTTKMEEAEKTESADKNVDKVEENVNNKKTNEDNSNLFLYIDMHGHASKKGVFMYGNHFTKLENSIECMLLPKIMSLNSQNFQFTACNFTERNMYLRDKRDGTSREGSGRVAVFRLTGLVRCYTLECNYNTGRFVNVLPQCIRDLPGKQTPVTHLSPPKFTPNVYEEVGRSLAFSILDLTSSNPWSRIPNSEYHTLHGIRDWLRLQSMAQSYIYQRLAVKSKTKQPGGGNSSAQAQTQVMVKLIRPTRLAQSSENSEDSERKENITDEAGPSNQKRIIRMSGVLQARVGLKKDLLLTAAAKKPTVHESEAKRPEAEEKKVNVNCYELNRPRSEPCVFKQESKRLKITPSDTWMKKCRSEEHYQSLPGTSTGDKYTSYSRLPRPVTDDVNTNKKRLTKQRSAVSPLKFKKCLEKRRNSDATKKKSRSLFRKTATSVINTSDFNTVKRRKKN